MISDKIGKEHTIKVKEFSERADKTPNIKCQRF